MLHVGDRLDRLVCPGIDIDHVGPGFGREHDVARRRRLGDAFGLVFTAEIHPSNWRPRRFPDRDVKRLFQLWERVAKRRRALPRCRYACRGREHGCGHERQHGAGTQCLFETPSHCGPFPSCRGHISHKRLVLGLSCGSHFK